MLLQEKIYPLIQEITEEQHRTEAEPEYLKTLFSDHSHILVDYDTIKLL